MTELTLLHESLVDASEIDSLGHMNVRFYLSRMDTANRKLLQAAGVSLTEGELLRRVDTYTRFHREQFTGAPLHTYGGFISTSDFTGVEGIGAYYEIRNPISEQVAASFIVFSSPLDVATQKLRGITLAENPITIPPYGQPRSLSLAAPSKVGLAELELVVKDDQPPGMMSGRRENIVHADDCDSNGRLHENVDLMFILHRSAVNEPTVSHGPPIQKDAEGRRYSWAMVETRSVVWNRPMAGDHVTSIGADVAVGEKWRQSRRWMFVKDSGLPLGISDSLGMCIDLDARRAIAMPASVRASVEQSCVPQFL